MIYLCFPFAKQEGNRVLSGGADNAARMLDLQANPNSPQQVAAHDAPVKSVKWVDQNNGILVTGSWDKTVKVLLDIPTSRVTSLKE
jgi:mRNA export factor